MLADVFSYSATISVTGASRWQSVPCPTSSDVLPGCYFGGSRVAKITQNDFIINSVVSFAKIEAFQLTHQMHHHLVRCSRVSFNSLMTTAPWHRALPLLEADAVAFNTALDACAVASRWGAAIDLAEEMGRLSVTCAVFLNKALVVVSLFICGAGEWHLN